MKKNLLVIFLFSISNILYCQMDINDPQTWWGTQPASIENIEVEIRTIGAFAETAIAFDIRVSDPDYYYGNDLLEFTFDFELNEGAVVNDSWLWINDYISKGDVYEQGEGTQIYESIVDRQQDPSILTQLSSTEYNLKVYPLQWDSTRRVRISYLEPLDYYGKRADVKLPLDLIKFSEDNPEYLSVTIYEDDDYDNGGLNEDEWTVIEEGADYKKYANTLVYDREAYNNINVSFSFEDPEKDYFISTHEGVDDNYYQLVYYPQIELDNSVEYKMIVLDYDKFTCDESFQLVTERLTNAMADLDDEDYFMISTFDFTTQFSSEAWLLATQENIDLVMSEIGTDATTLNSKLSILLPEALNRVEELKEDAEIIILSSDNKFHLENSAKVFLHEITEFYNEMETEIKMSVFDYADDKPTAYIDGVLYSGNDYLYESLSDLTNGLFYSEKAGDNMHSSLSNLFSNSLINTNQYEFHLSKEGGFTYANFNSLKNEFLLGSNQPIVSTGKYIGDGPFEVSFNARANNQIFSDTKKLEEQSNDLGEMAVSIWNAEFIKSLQASSSTEDKRDVIQTSIDERLLSFHTVFLCLEPDFESISENNNSDGDNSVVSVEEEVPAPKFELNAYPNPFIEKLNIVFTMNEVSANEQVLINILDSRGQLVERITLSNGLVIGSNLVEWIPEMDLNDGIYIVQVLVNDTMYNQKVLHVRY